QKSTTTGVSALRTSCSKLASVTSSTPRTLPPRPASEAPAQGGRPEQRHLPDRLEHDRAAHLGAAGGAVDERDRDLGDAEPGADGAVGRLDLEGVAARGDGVQVDAF